MPVKASPSSVSCGVCITGSAWLAHFPKEIANCYFDYVETNDGKIGKLKSAFSYQSCFSWMFQSEHIINAVVSS